MIIATVPSFFFLNSTSISEKHLEYTDLETNTEIDGEPYYVHELSFPFHISVVTTWLGMFLLSIYGGIGMIFLPYNYLNDYIFRPKPISESDFNKR